MEGSYNNQMGSERANFPAYLSSSSSAGDHHYPMDMNTFIQLQSAHPEYFRSPEHYNHQHQSAAVKSEGGAGSSHPRMFQAYPCFISNDLGVGGPTKNATDTNSRDKNESCSSSTMEGMKAKIIAHPHYSNLLDAYMDCQKVGAPPELAAKLSALRQDYETTRHSSSLASSSDASKDPELDQFMEAYCDMLVKYKEELTRPVQEAMEFMRTIESQLNLLSNGRALVIHSDERTRSEGMGSSGEDPDNSGGETELPELDPRAEDRELKNHLLKKYSGYLSSLKQELSKKKKKGKLPKEARQKLVSWWELHYKWPYPSESEKVALAEATGLDQKQINNWFINQRKRHWKPSEDMQFMVMDGLHHHHPHNAAFYMEANGHNYMGDHPNYRFST